MRLTLIGLALLTGTLLTAGSGLALVEAIGSVAAFGNEQVESTCDYVASAGGPDACETAEPAVASLGPAVAFAVQSKNAAEAAAFQQTADALAKAGLVQNTAGAIAGNLLGQAGAATDLAGSIADTHASTLVFADNAAADAYGKAQLATDAATAIASNLQGQALAGTDLAGGMTADLFSTANAIVALELAAVGGAAGSFPPECLLQQDASMDALADKQACLFPWFATASSALLEA